MIVTVTPTIGDGTVVRWYYDADALADLHGIEPMVSASRNGVRIGTYLHCVPDEIMTTAQDAYEQLRRDSDADLKHLATHTRAGLFAPLVPVTP
ncbi:hypothetical protein [Micromonospora chokoriensis]|uniref:hypothetical protein n=1 Tax=Micromonospora chokoriensis TaxID=356851 RepID=UPI0004C374EF|nr:hypothetical protein [Micromonospora chokoriensis]